SVAVQFRNETPPVLWPPDRGRCRPSDGYTRRPMLSPRARESLTVAALLGLITFFFLDILLGGLNLYLRDIALVYYPDDAVLRSLIHSGALPLWNQFAS